MTVLTEENRKEIINAVMERKFGKLLDWKRPQLLHEFGANNLDDVDYFENRLRVVLDDVRTAFEEMSDDALQEISCQLKNDMSIQESEWSTMGAAEIGRLHRFKLPPIAFGFGHPKYEADFDYWVSMPKLTLHEVCMLSVGADPSSISEDQVLKLAESRKKGETLWSAYEYLLKRREFFVRHFRSTGWGYPAEYVQRIKEWIDQSFFEVHPVFYAGLEARVLRQPSRQNTPKRMEVGSQERETLLKLIAAMACEQYGYDPHATRSEAASRIKDDVEHIGQSMDAKTIRKWLKEASKLVDEDYWSESE